MKQKVIYYSSILIGIVFLPANMSIACDGAHGEFSMPGLIISSESNRISTSFSFDTKKTEEDGTVQTKTFSFSYTHQLKESETQFGLQLPIFNTTSSSSSDTFLGDLKAFIFVPTPILSSTFSGFYGKVSVPTSGSGHEKGHTHAEYDGSLSLTSGIFLLQVLPDGFDLTANADFSYYFPTELNSPIQGEHHTIPTTAPTTPNTPASNLSNGFGYSTNIGAGFTPEGTLTRFGARLGRVYRSPKTLGDESIAPISNWSVSVDATRSFSHSSSLGLGLTKSVSGIESTGLNAFYEFKF